MVEKLELKYDLIPDKDGIMRIDIQDVIDYCYCPMYYFLRTKYPDIYSASHLYDVRIKECFYRYIKKFQADGIFDITSFKSDWGETWIKPRYNRQSNILCYVNGTKNDTHELRRKDGIKAIIALHNLLSVEKQYPILVNTKYDIPITKNIYLTGTFEYIREFVQEDNKSIIQLCFLITSYKGISTPTRNFLDHGLFITSSCYAFLKTFNIDNDSFQPVIFEMYKKRKRLALRSMYDYELLKRTIINTVKCIVNNIWCISPDDKCFLCKYRMICLKTLNNNAIYK